MHVNAGAGRGQNKVPDPLELKLQAFFSPAT